MNKRSVPVVGLVATGLAFVVAVWAQFNLPERVATHWNIFGQPDGYSSKFVGVWLLPFLILGMYVLFLFVPRIDPKAKNIQKFYGQWLWFIGVMQSFLVALYAATVYWNAGHEFDFGRFMSLLFGLLFIAISRLVAVAEQNYTIGVRTPWTLANKTVWKKTHELSAKLFLAVGICAFVGIIVPVAGFIVVIVGSLLASAVAVGYSYIVFQKVNKTLN